VFGVGKRRYGLGLVMAKTKRVSESWFAMVIFVINVAGANRDTIFSYYYRIVGPPITRFCSIFFRTASKNPAIFIIRWGFSQQLQPQNVAKFLKQVF